MIALPSKHTTWSQRETIPRREREREILRRRYGQQNADTSEGLEEDGGGSTEQT